MIIGVDLRGLDPKQTNGVSVYTLNLLKQLVETDDLNSYKIFLNRQNLKAFEGWFSCPKIKFYNYNIPNKILNSGLALFNYPKIDKLIGGADIYWLPNLNFLALTKKPKLIITIHDLSFKLMPELYSWKRQIWHKLIRPLKIIERAEQVLTVSENTRQDLIKYYDLAENKSEVVRPGESEIKENFHLASKENIILSIATFEPRKNLDSVILAFDKLLEKTKDLKNWRLVIAGQQGWRHRLLKKSLKTIKCPDNVSLLTNVDNEQIFNLYKKARIFIWPSYYEGYGFPPQQALKNDNLVIASFNSSLIECLPKKTIFINPFNLNELTEALAVAIKSSLNDNFQFTKSRPDLDSSWPISAKKFLTIINKL